MMRDRSEDNLLSVVNYLHDKVDFFLVHESSLYAWGIDNVVMLSNVDLLLLGEESFSVLDCVCPSVLGEFSEWSTDGVSIRLWSRASLGLAGPFSVTSCARYGCSSLAPELVLAKVPYSPDYRLLLEQRARLASIVYADALSDDEIALVARYVRGD